MTDVGAANPAEEASAQALAEMFTALENGQSFLVEAGAGAGKTYSLVKALQYLIERDGVRLPVLSKRVACITFTNVAKDEIEARIDRHPLVYCDTTHGFCWSLISGFQKALRELVPAIPAWTERLDEAGGIGSRIVEYSLGHRGVRDDRITLHHDDVIPLTISLMGNPKFLRIVTDRFPVILIDEYQDTHAGWIDAIKDHFLGQPDTPQFGFFGDHWQKIYGDGCGHIEDPALAVIGKEANFRSVATIVDALNRMRPELPQAPEDPDSVGEIRVFHTDGWQGVRRTGAHWGGDLPEAQAQTALRSVLTTLGGAGWDFDPKKTKILMLTHRVLASEQGYSSLPTVFQYNDAFVKKENPYIEFFVDQLEPACDAFRDNQYGKMFAALSGMVPLLQSPADKAAWQESMAQVEALRETGTIGQVVDHLVATRRPRLPDRITDLEQSIVEFDPDAGEEMPRSVREAQSLRDVPYRELISLRSYLEGFSPFETKHGVKGAEFENVLVVVGRGWNQYNFKEMLELAGNPNAVPADRLATYERNRNLFYVACSRPKRRLALLFTQLLSPASRATLEAWFDGAVTEALNLNN